MICKKNILLSLLFFFLGIFCNAMIRIFHEEFYQVVATPYPDQAKIEKCKQQFIKHGGYKNYETIRFYYDGLDVARNEALYFDIIAANRYNILLGFGYTYSFLENILHKHAVMDDNTLFFFNDMLLDYVKRASQTHDMKDHLFGMQMDGRDFYDVQLDSLAND